MKFSVLMSLYCKENPIHLEKCIHSILRQTLLPSEIIIVKDGKLTKELDCIIEKFKNENPCLFNIIELEENKGLGIALAIGLEKCKYDIIARMDTDDICREDRFEKQMNIFKNDYSLDVVGSYISEFENDISKPISLRKVPINHKDICDYAKKRNPMNHMTVMYKKSSVIKSGNYKPFLWNEDYYLWVRMIVNKNKFYNIPESLVHARTGASMFERRGSLAYAKKDIELQREFYKIGFINLSLCIKNCVVRSIIRIIPNKLRRVVYLNFLRSKK